MLLGVSEDKTLLEALKHHPWEASARHQANWTFRDKEFVDLEVLYDKQSSDDGEGYDVVQRDVPVSFSQEHRRYSFRTVAHATVSVRNGAYAGQRVDHDPWSVLGKEV